MRKLPLTLLLFLMPIGCLAATSPPLSQANKTNAQISVWANDAVISVYSYDFANHVRQLEQASNYFTPAGWKEFTAALGSSHIMSSVIKNKMTVSAVTTAPPKITKQGVQSRIYTWHVQMPILVVYQNSEHKAEQHLLVKLMIIRTAPFATPGGVGVQRFSASVIPTKIKKTKERVRNNFNI